MSSEAMKIVGAVGDSVEKDMCEFCLGAKNGTPGNENNFLGVIVCDHCTVLLLKILTEKKKE